MLEELRVEPVGLLDTLQLPRRDSVPAAAQRVHPLPIVGDGRPAKLESEQSEKLVEPFGRPDVRDSLGKRQFRLLERFRRQRVERRDDAAEHPCLKVVEDVAAVDRLVDGHVRCRERLLRRELARALPGPEVPELRERAVDRLTEDRDVPGVGQESCGEPERDLRGERPAPPAPRRRVQAALGLLEPLERVDPALESLSRIVVAEDRRQRGACSLRNVEEDDRRVVAGVRHQAGSRTERRAATACCAASSIEPASLSALSSERSTSTGAPGRQRRIAAWRKRSMRVGIGAETEQLRHLLADLGERVDVERDAEPRVERLSEREHRLLVEQRLEPDGRTDHRHSLRAADQLVRVRVRRRPA